MFSSENNRKSRALLDAYWRQGLREVGAALYGPGTVAQPAEYGMPGTATPGEVQKAREAAPASPATSAQEPRRTLDDRVKEAEAARVPEPPQRDLEKE